MRTLLPAVALALLVSACGDSGSDRSRSDPTEAGLQQADQAYSDAFAEGEYATMYSYLHESMKAKCPQEDFAGLMRLRRGFYLELAEAEYRISEVKVTGNRGTVAGEYFVDDRSLGVEDDAMEYWTFDDGKWWLATNDEEPCLTDLEAEVTTD